MNAPATVAAYLAYPFAKTDLQVRLAWRLMGVKKSEYVANNDSKSKEQELELMEALRVLISRDDSAFAAYDPMDIKAAKYLIIASSDDLYTPRSLFSPDVIFLTAPNLDWGNQQA